ncbi:AAA family ATPase [Actinospongicola halichondriae]|uniref:AAA family ATPase n=1 Tax=Actinospongicola halichondriae TaxID=3236844 RepID=UPI003D375ADD
MTKILVLDRGDGLAEQIRGLSDQFSESPKITACTRIGAVGEMLEEEGPFDLLVAGPSLGTRSGLARLRIIAEELPEMRMVLAFSRRPDASLRDIVRTGAIDLLQLPVEDSDLVESLERAAALVPEAPAPVIVEHQVAAASTATTAVEVPEPVQDRPGIVYTIASATGGCGKTFYATNLAWFLHKWMGKKVCIVDLDLQFGEVSTALRLRPKYTIFDALQREDADESDLTAHIEEYTVVHDTGVHVLAAPREPSEADRISPPDVTRILEAVRNRFDYVLVDTPPALAETVLVAFDLSDLLYVMATLDLPSVRNMSVFLSTLERLKIDTGDLRLILNKAEEDIGIDIDQVTKLFPQGFESVLPYAKEVSRSINLGMPVMAASPEAEISRLMAQGMKLVLPDALQNQLDSEIQQKRAGIRRFFRK